MGQRPESLSPTCFAPTAEAWTISSFREVDAILASPSVSLDVLNTSLDVSFTTSRLCDTDELARRLRNARDVLRNNESVELEILQISTNSHIIVRRFDICWQPVVVLGLFCCCGPGRHICVKETSALERLRDTTEIAVRTKCG